MSTATSGKDFRIIVTLAQRSNCVKLKRLCYYSMRFTKRLHFAGKILIEKRMYNSTSKTIMKKPITVLTVLCLAFSLLAARPASASTDSKPEDNSGAVVCPTDVYLQAPYDCLPLGPSEYLTEMARLGLTFPPQPLPAHATDPSLKVIPFFYKYYKVDPITGTGFYPSLEAAQEKEGASRILPSGKILYVAYTGDGVDTKKGVYFQLPSGEWMPGDGSRVSLLEYQPGLEFQATPRNRFGWNWDPGTPVRNAPNILPDSLSTRTLDIYEVVKVYSTQNIEGTDWDLIGPNEWVESRKIATVSPDTTPPQGVTNGRWIDVDLAEQTVSVYDNQQLVFATIMASGDGNLSMWTRPGLFQIYLKKEFETMSGDQGTPDYYYLENVPWTMYFDKARALHGAYWRTRLGFVQSHGCVNMTIGDAHWLFNWAHEGDWVYVHDPSGLTPTDPASYGDGGGS